MKINHFAPVQFASENKKERLTASTYTADGDTAHIKVLEQQFNEWKEQECLTSEDIYIHFVPVALSDPSTAELRIIITVDTFTEGVSDKFNQAFQHILTNWDNPEIGYRPELKFSSQDIFSFQK